jgi:hypothetical protein
MTIQSLSLTFWLGAGTNFTSGTLQTTWGSTVNANRAVGQVNLQIAHQTIGTSQVFN